MTQALFSPLRLGPLTLAHRVVMAPLTRMRAGLPGNVPHALNVEYYRQRASQGGLIISEGTQISPTAQGMPATPGIHSQAQIEGWKAVTQAVHDKGGLIFLQLWHVGRISHSSLLGGQLPVAPSPIAAPGKPPRYEYVLTELGWSFRPVMLALTEWGNERLSPEGHTVQLLDRASGRAARIGVVDLETGRPITRDSHAVVSGPAADAVILERFAQARTKHAATERA